MLHIAYGTLTNLGHSPSRLESRARQVALRLYRQVGLVGWLGQIGAILSGRSCYLLNLAEVEAGGSVAGRYSAGLRSVPIRQIQGTQGRSQDFDRHFRPLKSHTRNRWLRIASARQLGLVLPPVELVQVGDIYFVRDGHHRISVAQALGQVEIEAEVRVWQVANI